MFSLLVVSLAVCTLAVSAQDEGWRVEDYPNPMTQPALCGRESPSYICDPDFLLKTDDNKKQLDRKIGNTYNNTKCSCSQNACSQDGSGFKIAVALVEKLDISQGNVRSTLNHAMLFAYRLLTSWNLGNCGEGVVILYSKKDNVFCTVTGIAAGKTLQSGTIGEISVEARSEFTSETVYKGLERLISQYHRVFTGNYEPKNYPKAAAVVGSNNGASALAGTVALFLPLFLAAFLHL